jgi:predicted transcriptional regulator
MKRVFVFIVMVSVAVLVVMAMTKPAEMEHYAAVRGVAVKFVDQKVADSPVPEDLTTIGSVMAMSAVDQFLRQNMEVQDYMFVTVATVKYQGMNIPVSIGAFGKVRLLVDEGKLQHLIK